MKAIIKDHWMGDFSRRFQDKYLKTRILSIRRKGEAYP